MITQLIATKKSMMQTWDSQGVRIPVTVVQADDCHVISSIKDADSILIGGGSKKLKNVKKPMASKLVKAGLTTGFRLMHETALDAGEKETLLPGTKIVPSQVLQIGDLVKVTGTSKGTGFTGVVKRHGFKGGPRTHGQSDRERAPGSIGAGTTPGRVYKNKRMAGRAGNERVTVLGMTIVGIDDATGNIMIKGCIPGSINGVVTITKMNGAQA